MSKISSRVKSIIQYFINYDYKLFLKIYCFMTMFIIIYFNLGLYLGIVNDNSEGSFYTLYLIGLLAVSTIIVNVGQFVYKGKEKSTFSANSFGAFAYGFNLLLFAIYLEFFSSGNSEIVDLVASFVSLIITVQAFTMMVPFNSLKRFKSDMRLQPKYKYGKTHLILTQLSGEERYISLISFSKYLVMAGVIMISIPLVISMVSSEKLKALNISIVVGIAIAIVFYILAFGEYVQIEGEEDYEVEEKLS